MAGALAGAGGLAIAVLNDPPPPETPRPLGAPLNYGGAIEPLGPGVSLDDAINRATISSGVEDIRVVNGPGGQPFSSASWLEIEVSTESLSGPGEALVTWKAALAQGAVADLHRTTEASTNAVVGGSDIEVTLPSGRQVTLDGSAGFAAAGQTFDDDIADPSPAAIADRVREETAEFGLVDVSVEVLQPIGPAVLIHATMPANDSEAPIDWTMDDLRNAISGTPAGFEGVYIEIASPNGAPVVASGVAYRTGVGVVWFAPGQDDRFGLVHGALCPATADLGAAGVSRGVRLYESAATCRYNTFPGAGKRSRETCVSRSDFCI
jgi:hypothetical protein